MGAGSDVYGQRDSESHGLVFKACSSVGWGAAVYFPCLPTTALQKMVLPQCWTCCVDVKMLSTPLSTGLVPKAEGT